MPNAIVQASAKGLPLFLAYREWLHNEAMVLGCELFEGFYGKKAIIILEMFNPRQQFHVPCDQLLAIHKVTDVPKAKA